MPTEPALELGTGVLIHERKRKARVGHRLATAAPCARGRGREAEARRGARGHTYQQLAQVCCSASRAAIAMAAAPRSVQRRV